MTPAVQRAELDRVEERIAPVVLAFARSHRTFHAADLLAAVRAAVPSTSPDSPSRILRQLRKRGQLSYEVVNRRASLYRVLDGDLLF